MNINPGMAAPLASKNLGDLSKNHPAVKELLTAILKAVEHVGAHKVTGRKQGVSLLSFSIYRLVYCRLFFFFFFFCSAAMDSGCLYAVQARGRM
jgi:hypothetical protein